MSAPVRLQLSRTEGFSLQDHSLSVNGLPAVNVAYPSRFGKPVTKKDFQMRQNMMVAVGLPLLRGTWREHAVRCFDGWIGGEIPELGIPPTAEDIIIGLRGKNLACWCGDDEPCRADILLRLANVEEQPRRVTRDKNVSAEAAQLFLAFNKCADGYSSEVVLNMAANFLVTAINTNVSMGGGGKERISAWDRDNHNDDGPIRKSKAMSYVSDALESIKERLSAQKSSKSQDDELSRAHLNGGG